MRTTEVNFTIEPRTINSTRGVATAAVQWRPTEKGEETSVLAHLASVLQMSPWMIAALCCLAYTLVMLLILAIILGCRRAFSRSIFTAATSSGGTDTEELIEAEETDDSPPPSYWEVVATSPASSLVDSDEAEVSEKRASEAEPPDFWSLPRL